MLHDSTFCPNAAWAIIFRKPKTFIPKDVRRQVLKLRGYEITIDELMSQSQSSEPTSTTTTTHNNNNNNTRSNQTNQHNRTNGQRGNPHASGGRGYSTPSRTTTKRRSNTSVAKSGRHERREEELRNDAMSECTFQPKITKLPASYGAARSYVKENFHSRVMKWKETREKSLAQRREDNVLEEMDNCTFKPEVNAPGFRSHRAVSTPRGRTSQSSERSTAKNVVERLYSTQRKATRTTEAELKRSREEEFKRTCTFQPNVGKRRNGRRAMTPSRYQQEQRKREPKTF